MSPAPEDGIVAIIPARGGSKRIPRKNLRLLGGKPLLQWTVAAARDSGMFDHIVLSSDDEEVLALAEPLGAIADRRPPFLAGDHATAVAVVHEYVSRPSVRGRFGSVALLLPTCPFRTAGDVQGAVTAFREQGAEFLIGMAEYAFPPQLAWVPSDAEGSANEMRMVQPEVYGRTTRSQSIPGTFHPNGSIYLARVESFLREGTFFVDPCATFLMPPERSVDIDHPWQLAMAEALVTETRIGEREQLQTSEVTDESD